MRVYTIGWVAMMVIVVTLIWLSNEPISVKSYSIARERDGKTTWIFYQGERNYEYERLNAADD